MYHSFLLNIKLNMTMRVWMSCISIKTNALRLIFNTIKSKKICYMYDKCIVCIVFKYKMTLLKIKETLLLLWLIEL